MGVSRHQEIINPERVQRILHRICESHLPVVVRPSADATELVRARVTHLIGLGEINGLRLGKISARGMLVLRQTRLLQVEFALMSAKIVFLARVIVVEPNSVVISVPHRLVNVERRETARFETNEQTVGFLTRGETQFHEDDLASAPAFLPYGQFEHAEKIIDVSMGGLCTSSLFPRSMEAAEQEKVFEAATLYLPMGQPVVQALQLRWARRHRSPEGSVDLISGPTEFRFGYAFAPVNGPAKSHIRAFIQLLTQSKAI